MKRMQVELRPRAPVKKREPPPSYEEALFMADNPTADLAPTIDAVGSRPARDEDNESYGDSFESEDREEHRDDNPVAAEPEIVPPSTASELADKEFEDGKSDEGDQVDNDPDRSDNVSCSNEETDSPSVLDDGFQRGPAQPAKSKVPDQQPRDRPTVSYYDQHTYTVISRLRAVNKRLTHQLELQNKQVTTLNEEKKQHLQLIETLRADLQMHKQTLRALQLSAPGGIALGTKNHPHETSLPVVPRPPQQQNHSSSRDEKDEGGRCLTPRSPASQFRRPPTTPSSPTTRASPRAKTPVLGEKCCGSCGKASSQDGKLAEMYLVKLEKAEEERKEMQARHAHQLANYSHELSRLERLLEKTHVLAQEKDNELRLQRTRQLYCTAPATPPASGVVLLRRNSNAAGNGLPQNSTTGRRDSLQVKNIFSDDIWKGLLPLPVPKPVDNAGDTKDRPTEAVAVAASTTALVPVSFTSHVGRAFDQLLNHQLVSLHDNTLDRSTREWLQEVRHCGSQMLTLHHSFQVLAHSLQRLAECTHLYQLAETLTEECRELLQAEQALVLVVDKSEQEFWCRMPSRLATEDVVESKTDGNKPQMGTVRSTLLPLTNTGSPFEAVSVAVPCGMASLVYHTKRPLLLAAGQMTRHPKYSVATDNSDRLISFPGSSTLLVPIIHDNRVVAVVQVCGKLTQVEALGLSIALERSATFTPEDQSLLTLMCHFSSGLFPKVAYFTDVESNKVNEETFIQLAPEIFTCLHFDELGKVVIQNAKNILDADRCSLFVADSASRTLHNWHSDISGAGVEVYQRSAQKADAGMTIHFGQGIVGLVAETQQPINIPDAYDDPRFNSAWDQKTHYRTKSMLTVPIISNMGAIEKPSENRAANNSKNDSADGEQQSGKQAPRDQNLLGVVQVINKSGGAPFRAKDEFLLQTISKLIALAIENSQLFQRNQELCWNVGKLIADGDLVEAIVSLGTAAEQIIGVEGAAVYVMDPDTHEMVTFHHKRRYRIALGESAYSGSLMEDAIRSQQLTIVNDVSKTPSFNAFVDSISGIPARNVLFAPLIIEDSDSILPELCKLPSSSALSPDSGQKLVGLLQLVNIKGRKSQFDPHDLFLSIVQSQSCSVLAAILEKQRMLRQKEQIALLLDASMSFFKEMSVVGVINAVYNACVSIFDADTTAHLFLWEDSAYPVDKDRERHMWTSKISPQAAASLASRAAPLGSTTMQHVTTDARGATAMSFIPSLGAQARKLSVVTDQTLRAPASEGLFQHVLMRGSAVIVKSWISDEIEEEEGEPDISVGNQDQPQEKARRDTARPLKGSANRRPRPRADKYTLKATRSDVRLGFSRHAVVACPVWSSYGQEIVGVLVLLFPRDHAAVAGGARSEQLSTLPILTRQISGALGVCQDLITVSTRARRMQGMLELSRQARKAAVSFTLTSRGHLGSFSQPINVCSRAFSSRALYGELHPVSAANLTVHSLYMDESGHRWCFQLSGVTAHEMSCDHYVQWIGKHVELPSGYKESEVFAKLRTDLQNVYARKEVITGVIDTRPHQLDDGGHEVDGSSDSQLETAVPPAVLLKIRQLLWGFTDAAWQVDLTRASHALFGAFVRQGADAGCKGKILLSRRDLELALSTEHGGAGISLGFVEWDQLHAFFADGDTGLVDVEAMLLALRPQLKAFPTVTYELAPVLDTVTQAVVSVQVLLHS